MLSACTGVRAPAGADLSGAGTVAFVGVHLLPMTPGSGVVPDQTVLVRDGRIAAIGPVAEVRVPRDAVRIEAAGQYLMPGLVDMHVHLEHFQDPDLLKLFLANGVTTVRNMDGRPYILQWREAITRGDLPGPTIYTAGPLLDGDPPILDDNTVVRSPAEARVAVLEQAAAGYDFIKVYTNLSEEAYRAILETAREAGLPVAGHVPRRVGVLQVLEAGQRTIEHLADYGALVEAGDSPFRNRFHWSKLYLAMPADSARMEAAAGRIAGSGVWAVPTLIQAERAIAPPESVRAWLATPEMAYIPADGRAFWEEQAQQLTRRMDAEDWELVRRGRENRQLMVRSLHRAGAHLLVGTDTPNPFVLPGYSVAEELASVVDAGIPPAEALAAATREAARFSGELEEWGTIEVGKRADLLLLQGNPLSDVRNVRRPAGVMVRGQWLPAVRLEEMLRSFAW